MTDTFGKRSAFIEHLEQLAAKKDRAALAGLRRSLGKAPSAAGEAHPHVLRFNPPERDEIAYYLVAGLFALHYEHQWKKGASGVRKTNFGASFALLLSKLKRESIEKRFVALLNSHVEELPDHLRHAVGLFKANDIPVDWQQLLFDLCRWQREDRKVQRDWARAFWGDNSEPANHPNNSNDSQPKDQ